MEWDYKDHNDWRVVEYTGWRLLSNYGSFQERAGVYIFANSALQVKYIGKAGPGRMVVEIQNAISRGKDYGATQVKALYTNSDVNANTLEQALIEKYKPPNNYT